MRIEMTMTDLDEERWAYLQANVQAQYTIPEDETRVCLTFTYGEETRHVEMPVGSVLGLLVGLGVAPGLYVAAMAALTPDALPDFFKNARETGSTGPSYGAGPYTKAENLEPWPFGESEETQENQRAADMEIEDYERREAELLDEVPESRSTELPDGV